MGVLVPEDFPIRSLANNEERLVVQALVDALSDSWLVIPDVGMTDRNRDHQADIVIAHAREGVAVIEVKGHRVSVVQGQWHAHGARMETQPMQQARDNSYTLRNQLRGLHPTLQRIEVAYGVALPNTTRIDGTLPDADPSQVILGPALADRAELRDAIERLMTYRYLGQLGDEGLAALVAHLRPDITFEWDPEARARLARARLDRMCDDQIRALESLDLNRRVFVRGGAGTGKTRLATAWARRAVHRGERVLLVCFNVPLGGQLQDALPEDDDVAAGAYYDVVRTLAGMPEIDVPLDADAAWWAGVADAHLATHWDEIEERFDTLIVDEAQDFHPAWLAALERLLRPGGRVLMVGDARQALYARGFVEPGPDDGWTRCELVANCRNTYEIARLLESRLGGAVVPGGTIPDGDTVSFVEAPDLDEATEAVGDEIDRLVDHDDHETTRVLVATCSSAVRDHLRDALALVPWEDAGPRQIVCETVHRVKGLEFDHVVLVALDPDIDDAPLYVGVSRAVAGLTVVGPAALGARLGLGSP